jgi:hypothetical protein
MTVFFCSVYFLFRLASLAHSNCNLRPLRGLRSLPLTLWFLSLLVGWGCLGGEPPVGWGERVQRETHGVTNRHSDFDGVRGSRRTPTVSERTKKAPKAAFEVSAPNLEDALASVGASGGVARAALAI